MGVYRVPGWELRIIFGATIQREAFVVPAAAMGWPAGLHPAAHGRFSTRPALGNDHGKCNPGWPGGGGTAGNEPHVLFICSKSRSAHCVPVRAGAPALPRKVHTRLLQRTALGWQSAALLCFAFPFGVWALPSQALPLCLSTMLLPCAAFPARSLAPRPRAQPLHGAAFGIKDSFPLHKFSFSKESGISFRKRSYRTHPDCDSRSCFTQNSYLPFS